MQHDFRYVSKNESKEVKNVLLEIIHTAQNLVRDKFTFSYRLVGSSQQNMITCDLKSNIGFDFDVNIQVNVCGEDFTAEETRTIICDAFECAVIKYGYDHCKNSTRFLTIHFKDRDNSKILHSCDIAIVSNCNSGSQQYVCFNQEQNNYYLENQPIGYELLPEKIAWLKENDLWNALRRLYIEKKNQNTDPNKKFRAIFAEAINEICTKNCYYL